MEKSGLIIHQLPRSKGRLHSGCRDRQPVQCPGPIPLPTPHLQGYGGLTLFVRVTFEIFNNWKWHRCQLGWSGSGGEWRELRSVGAYQVKQVSHNLSNCFCEHWLNTSSVLGEET